jgi:hypothetical protein
MNYLFSDFSHIQNLRKPKTINYFLLFSYCHVLKGFFFPAISKMFLFFTFSGGCIPVPAASSQAQEKVLVGEH